MNAFQILREGLGEGQAEALGALARHIHADPAILGGKPVFQGTRVPVWIVLDCLAEGMTHEEILAAFPSLEPAHIPAALKFSGLLAALH
jgi:uncharacterized protein (DUF433 family)